MPRRFTAPNNWITVGSAGVAGLNFTFGTMATVINLVSTQSAASIVTTNDEVSPCVEYYFAGGVLHYFDGTTDVGGGPTPTLGTTYILAVTKATGTATARSHILAANAQTWTHANFAATNVNGGAVTSFVIGNGTAAGNGNALDAEMFALGLWNGVVMTDSETERLARGRWLDLAPDFYEEFNGQNELADIKTTLGRAKSTQTATTGTWNRGTKAPPAGFRFAIQRRRR